MAWETDGGGNDSCEQATIKVLVGVQGEPLPLPVTGEGGQQGPREEV